MRDLENRFSSRYSIERLARKINGRVLGVTSIVIYDSYY